MLLILFIVSFLISSSLILIKMYEVHLEKTTLVTKKLSSFDGVVNSKIEAIRTVSHGGVKRVVTFVKKDLPHQSKENIVLLKNSVKNKYQTILPNIRGIRVLKQKGNVSQFLQDIQLDRDRVGKGRIEDFLA